MKDIIILCQPRTGSSLLSYALSFFKNYRNIGEIYSLPESNMYPYDLFFHQEEFLKILDHYNTKIIKNYLTKIQESPQEIFDLLDVILNRKKVLKILDYQLSYNPKLSFIFDRNVKFIILKRNNSLEQFVSLKIAEKTNTWYNCNTNNAQIYIDIKQYDDFKKQKYAFYNQILSQVTQKDFIILEYEKDLVNGITDKLLNKLEDFINDDFVLLDRLDKDRGKIKKQNTQSIGEKILNYNEIKHLL